jgi:hypothetical protein
MVHQPQTETEAVQADALGRLPPQHGLTLTGLYNVPEKLRPSTERDRVRSTSRGTFARKSSQPIRKRPGLAGMLRLVFQTQSRAPDSPHGL